MGAGRKGLLRGFLRRSPALTRKPIFPFERPIRKRANSEVVGGLRIDGPACVVKVWETARSRIAIFPLNSNESKIRAVLCRLVASLSRSSLQGESFCDQARRLQNALSASVLPDSRLIPWRLIPCLRGGVAVGGAQRARTPSLIRQSGDANHAPSEAFSLTFVKSGRRKHSFYGKNILFMG